jgi:hypothetical protein
MLVEVFFFDFKALPEWKKFEIKLDFKFLLALLLDDFLNKFS